MSLAEPTRWSRLRPLVYGVLVVVIVWLWFVAGNRIHVRSTVDSPVAEGLVLRAIDGDRLPIESFRGRVVVLNVWASWCGPCIREIPALERIRIRYEDSGVDVIGINIDDVDADRLLRIVDELGISYRVATAERGMSPPFRTEGLIPHTWVLDREGRIRVSHAGAASFSAFDAAVSRLLDES